MTTPYTPAPTAAPLSSGMSSGMSAGMSSGGPANWFRRAESWLDSKGRKAWIAAMVLSFIFFWPLGLAFVAYITFTNRWSKTMFGTCTTRRDRMAHHFGHSALRPSGNTAFDAYKADTLRRLEEEQQAFEAFLQRLRDAKDKSEFDTFMEDRARTNRPADTMDGTRGGEY